MLFFHFKNIQKLLQSLRYNLDSFTNTRENSLIYMVTSITYIICAYHPSAQLIQQAVIKNQILAFQCDFETESCNMQWTSSVTNIVADNIKGPINMIFLRHIRT